MADGRPEWSPQAAAELVALTPDGQLVVNCNILAFYVANLAQPLQEIIYLGNAPTTTREVSDPIDLYSRLGAGGERRAGR